MEEDKSVGPTTTITFLGIELDSVGLTIRLPEDKLKNLRKILKTWRAGKKRELLSDHCVKSSSPKKELPSQADGFVYVARKGLNDDIRINKSAQS